MRDYLFEDIAVHSTKKKKPEETDLNFYVGLEHLNPNDYSVDNSSVKVLPKGTKLIMNKGDVLFGKRRAYQKKVGIAPFDGIFSAHGMVLRPKKDVIDANFFPLFIKSDYFLNRAIKISKGSLSPTVNWGDLKVQIFKLPEIEKQKKIANNLWVLLSNIDECKSAIKNINKLIDSYILELFDKNEDSMTTIGRVVHEVKKVKAGKGHYPYIEIGDIDLNTKKYTYKHKKSVASSVTPFKNDIIVSTVRPTRGAICVVTDDDISISNAFVVLRANESQIMNEFLFYTLYKNRLFFDSLGDKSTGTTYPTCTEEDVLEFEIPKIQESKQLEFSNKIADFEKLITTINTQIEYLEKIVKSTLNDIFTEGSEE